MFGRNLLPAMAAVLVLGVAGVVAARSTAPRLVKRGTIYRLERGNLAYDFDCAWRVETLWRMDAAGVWQRVPTPGPELVEPLRDIFLLRTDHSCIGAVPVEGKAELHSVVGLGYL